MTSCPTLYVPDFCASPNPITLTAGCYGIEQGVVMRTAPLVSADTSIRLNWTVYVMADTAAKAPFFNPQVKQLIAGNVLTLPDSVIKDNHKIYVVVETSCTGKARGANLNVFVKRLNKASGCYYWGEQAR